MIALVTIPHAWTFKIIVFKWTATVSSHYSGSTLWKMAILCSKQCSGGNGVNVLFYRLLGWLHQFKLHECGPSEI